MSTSRRDSHGPQAKFNKSRLVPIDKTTQTKLREYERLRTHFYRTLHSLSFFLSESGTRLTDCTVRRWFIIDPRKIGLRGPTDSRGPRIHDVRHHFAIKTILNWYRRGSTSKLTCRVNHVFGPSACGGHLLVCFFNPEFLKLATQRLESRKGGTAHEVPLISQRCCNPSSPNGWWANAMPARTRSPVIGTPFV